MIQPTLDTALAAAELHQAGDCTREEWAAKFERAEWVAPYYSSADDRPAGAVTLGWRCPDCGDVEPNTCLLAQNHGYDPDIPGYGAGRGECTALMLRRAHAAYAAALTRCTAAGHDLTAGACNECRGAVRREREEARRG